MPCMPLLLVWTEGCEVKHAVAQLMTPAWKWLIALMWWLTANKQHQP